MEYNTKSSKFETNKKKPIETTEWWSPERKGAGAGDWVKGQINGEETRLRVGACDRVYTCDIIMLYT